MGVSTDKTFVSAESDFLI